MARKKKLLKRQLLTYENKRLRFYGVLDKIIDRRYFAYKKRDLERKRRYRKKQETGDAQYNPDVFRNFKCSFCHSITSVIQRFWGEMLCAYCYYDPLVMNRIIVKTVNETMKEDPHAFIELSKYSPPVISYYTSFGVKKPIERIMKEIQFIEETLDESYQIMPQFFSTLKTE